MKLGVRSFALVGLYLSLSACGGILTTPTSGFNPGVFPNAATLSPSQTLEVNIWTSETSADSWFYSVDGGDSNGTIVQDSVNPEKAVYTAPATPGNYIVRAGFNYGQGKKFTGIVNIKVQ